MTRIPKREDEEEEMELPTKPMLKPWYRLAREPGRVLLEYGGSLACLEGAAAELLLPALLPLLDGRRTQAEIVGRLGAEAAPAVAHALEALATADALTEGPPLPDDLDRPIAETVELLAASAPDGTGPAEVHARLRCAVIGLAGNDALCEGLGRLLPDAGIGSVERIAPEATEGAGDGCDLLVAAFCPGESELERLNRRALEGGSPWLATAPFDGARAWIGPLFVPGETCCWRCVMLRRAAGSGYGEELQLLERTRFARPMPPALAATVAGLAATLVLRWIGLRDPALPGMLWTLEQWPHPVLAQHVVYPVPRCPECSGLAGIAPPAPWFEETAA